VTARERRRFAICLGLAILVGLLMSISFVYHLVPGLEDVQNLLTDATIFKTRSGAANPATKVVLVHIDEKTISALKGQYGRVFSWPRTLHAQVLRNLADARARVVAYDVLFDAPGCPATAPQPCAEDVAFGDAVAYARAQPAGGTAVIFAQDGDPPEPEPLRPGQPLRFRGSIDPLPVIAQNALLGHIHPFPDGDGTVRRMPLFVDIAGKPVPALSLQAAAAYLRRPQAIEQIGPGYLYFGGRPLPTDDHYRALVNFQGPPSHLPDRIRGPVPVISFIDVLNGTFDQSLVRDKVVFIGLTAIGFADDYQVPTSVGLKMSGVEIHAQTAEMILRGAYLQTQGTVSTIAVILLLTVLPGVVLARLQPVLAAGVTLALFFAYVVLTVLYGTLAEGSLARAQTFTVLNNVYPGVAMLVTFIVVMLYRIIFEQAEQRLTKSTMGKYLSPAVMAEVLKAPESLQLGGQKREMTVLFSDIRGFTTVSEKMDPAELVNFLNEYLTEMTNIVFEHEGVLDKYMGDAIMAFWGAPMEQPNHAELACRTGYHMVRRLRELQQGWSERGLPLLNIGVGINTGPMTVGNVGSKMRFDYTVMGDAVNLGSRLEGVNKEYGTNIIISESTYAHVRDKFLVRFLDLVAVKGKQEPIAIYELIAPIEAAAGVLPEGFLEAWDEAMRLYRAQRFEEARAAFERALALKPGDQPCKVFIERSAELAEVPPVPAGAEWDGVYVFTHK